MVKYGRLFLITLQKNKGIRAHVWIYVYAYTDAHNHQYLAEQILSFGFKAPKVTVKYSLGTTCSVLRAGIFQLMHTLQIISFIFSGHKLLYFLITTDEIPLPKCAMLCTRVFSRNNLHISRNIKPKYFIIATQWRKVF